MAELLALGMVLKEPGRVDMTTRKVFYQINPPIEKFELDNYPQTYPGGVAQSLSSIDPECIRLESAMEDQNDGGATKQEIHLALRTRCRSLHREIFVTAASGSPGWTAHTGAFLVSSSFEGYLGMSNACTMHESWDEPRVMQELAIGGFAGIVCVRIT